MNSVLPEPVSFEFDYLARNDESYEKELSLYQNTISTANDRWQNVVKELQNKF